MHAGVQAKIANLATDTERKETLPSGFLFESKVNLRNMLKICRISYVERVPDYWVLISPISSKVRGTTFVI